VYFICITIKKVHSNISITVRGNFVIERVAEPLKLFIDVTSLHTQFVELSIDYVLPARDVASHKWKKNKNKTLTSIRHVSEPPPPVATKVSRRRNWINVRGRRTVHVLCGLPVRVTVWHVHDPLHFGMFSNASRTGSLQISLDNQRGSGRRKIYTLRTLYIFDSLAFMSLALVALNWRRWNSRIASEFSILISAKSSDRFGVDFSRDKLRTTGMNLRSLLFSTLWLVSEE